MGTYCMLTEYCAAMIMVFVFKPALMKDAVISFYPASIHLFLLIG